MSLRLKMRTNAQEILNVLENISDLTQEEQNNIKEEICTDIKEKIAKNPSMDLLKEEVLEDGSVVITISV